MSKSTRAESAPPVEHPSSIPEDAIAIIGIGCRYADARGPAEFWKILETERNTVREAPAHRVELGYDVDHFYDPRLRIPGKISSKKGGFLEHPELFDPAAFGIAPRDALTMEPQQRLMIEVTWDALEDAGIPADSLAGERVAVMLGYMAEDYSRERTGLLSEEAVYRGHDVFTVGGMSHAVLSGRISFLLGVTGPSFTLDTACSSSLYATHLACESLRRGEARMAIAGGANLFLSPEGNIALSRSGMLSPSGACKAFDASADGFVRAEGAGIVVLRPLADAIGAGDPIYAVIRGSGVSADGRDGGHMMAPGRKGQAQAMHDAYSRAGVSPADVQYVEAHGTGTMIGDPVEIAALTDVMAPGRDPERPLLVGSVKGNLGHSESASGVAGLIKAALSIHHRTLPAQLHFETPNPVIPWDEIPIRVQAETTPWPYPGPALVGVNSFGISGTNAHVILESPPVSSERGAFHRRSSPTARATLIPLSAHDPGALEEMVEQHAAAIAGDETKQRGRGPTLGDIGQTLGTRRSHRTQRLAVVADSTESLESEWRAIARGESSGAVMRGTARPDAAQGLVMIFPGQGAQWLGMGRGLLRDEPAFAQSIDRIDEAFRAHVDWSLRGVLEGQSSIDWRERLDVLQPVLVGLQISLAEVWKSWGITPAHVLGQSMGEIAAAHVAGVLSLEDTARLACERGRVVARVAGKGSMALLGLPRDRVEAALAPYEGRIEVAGHDSPTSTLVSGDRDAIMSAVAELDSRGVFARALDVDFASHCFHMDPVLDAFRERIAGITPVVSRVPIHSTVEGMVVSGTEMDVDYWVRNLREAVDFERGLTSCLEQGGRLFLEVSAHPTATRSIEEIARHQGQSVERFPSLQREQDERRAMLSSLGELFTRGLDVRFDAVAPEGRVIELPPYPYQRKRFWFAERSRPEQRRPRHPLLGFPSISSIDPRLHTWDFVFDEDAALFIADHRIAGDVVAPTSLALEVALAASGQLWPDQPIVVDDLRFHAALSLEATQRRNVQAVFVVNGQGDAEFSISSRAVLPKGSHEADMPWHKHVVGRVRCAPSRDTSASPSSLALEPLAFESPARHVETLARGRIEFGPRFRALREWSVEKDGTQTTSIVGHLKLPRAIESEWYAYRAHPALVEEALQLATSLFEDTRPIRVRAIEALAIDRALPSDCYCRVSRVPGDRPTGLGSPSRQARIEFFDAEGVFLGGAERLEATPIETAAVSTETATSTLHQIEWCERDLDASSSAAKIDHWLVISDSEFEAIAFGRMLEKSGASFRFCEKLEDFESLLEDLRRASFDQFGIVVLAWGEEGEFEPATHRRFRVGSWAHALRAHHKAAAEIWIATRALSPVPSRQPRTRERSLDVQIVEEALEFASHDELQRCRFFACETPIDSAGRAAMVSLMGRPSRDREFRFAGDRLLVPRLVPIPTKGKESSDESRRARTVAGDRPFSASHSGLDAPEAIAFSERPEAALQPHEVEIEPSIVGLCGLDVLDGLELRTRDDLSQQGVGIDLCGVVLRVGSAVDRFRVGERVLGVREGALGRPVVVPSTHLIHAPADERDPRARLPFPSLVARYALEHVARIRGGERVFIPSAGGGIGLALIERARQLGASVTANARRAEVRAVIEGAGAEVAAPDARTHPKFDVVIATQPMVPLHSLVKHLAPGGRLIDLVPSRRYELPDRGPVDLPTNASLCNVDAVEILRSDPERVADLLSEIERDLSLLPDGSLPTTVFPVAETARALRFQAQGRPVGRVIIDFDRAAETRLVEDPTEDNPLADLSFFVVDDLRSDTAKEVAGLLRENGACLIDPRNGDLAADLAIAIDSAPNEASARRRTDPRARRTIFVSIREERGLSASLERGGESRLWADRTLIEADAESTSWLSLSIGREDAAHALPGILKTWLQSGPAPSSWVHVAPEELDGLDGETSSALTDRLLDSRRSATDRVARRADLAKRSPAERRASLFEMVRQSLAEVVNLSSDRRDALDGGDRLTSLGLDSLMTVELFVGLGRDLELELSATSFPQDPTLMDIAEGLSAEILERKDGRSQ